MLKSNGILIEILRYKNFRITKSPSHKFPEMVTLIKKLGHYLPQYKRDGKLNLNKMSTKRNTKKFRKSLKTKKSTQDFKNQFKNKPNIVVFDMGLFDEKVKDYSKDVSTEFEVVENRLNLLRRFPSMGEVKIIITKTISGYSYEDVGMLKRNFTDLDYMIWEFELPKSLKEVILNLPIVNDSKESYQSDSMKEIFEGMSKPMVDFMKKENIIN